MIAISSATKIPESRGKSQDLAMLSARSRFTKAHEASLSRRDPSVKILIQVRSELSLSSSEKMERARLGFRDASFLLSGNLEKEDTGLSHGGGEQEGKANVLPLLNKLRLLIEKSGLHTGIMAGVLRGFQNVLIKVELAALYAGLKDLVFRWMM